MVDYNELRRKFQPKKPLKGKASNKAAVRAIVREYERKKAELTGGAPVIRKGIAFYAVVIIGLLLVGSLVLSVCGKGGRAAIPRKPLQAQKSMRALTLALGRYKYHVGAYPSTEEGLAVLALKAYRKKGWDGPYVNHIVPDPWGNDYVYETRPEGGHPVLYSKGPDGRAGTTDDVLPDQTEFDLPFRDTSWTRGWAPYRLRGVVVAPDKETKRLVQEEMNRYDCKAETPKEISVFSWNTEHYNFTRWTPEERRELEENMFALIRAADPDIFLIQETYGSFDRFRAAFPDYHAVLQSECNSVFSKFPIGQSRRLWIDKRAKTPPAFNTPILEFADVWAGDLQLRVSSFAMFWLPLCVFTPANRTVAELLADEAAPQTYPLTPRPEAIREIVGAMKGLLAERDRIPLVIGGDFNSLSHLDWTAANGRAQGHCGRAVPWPVSTAMVAAGFVDAYRTVHPDEVKDSGVTCPIAGTDARCPRPLVRIDYVYSAGSRLKPIACETIHGTYHKPFRWKERAFGMFPSDHAPVLVRYAVVVDQRSGAWHDVSAAPSPPKNTKARPPLRRRGRRRDGRSDEFPSADR